MVDDINNTAADGPADSYAATVIHSTILSTLLVLIITGNALLIFAILSTPRLRTITNCFIVSLAVSDVMVGLVVIPINFAFPTALLKGYTTCIYAACFTVIVCLSSISNIVAITVDRYLAITSPLKYHSIMTPRRTVATIVIIWIYAFVVGFLPVMGWRQTSTTCLRGEVYAASYAVFLLMMGLVLPLVISTTLYCRILREASRHIKQIRQCEVSTTAGEHIQQIGETVSQSNAGCGDGGVHPYHNHHHRRDQTESHHDKGNLKKNRKALRTVMYILVYFELSWVPLFVTLLIDAFFSPRLIVLEVRTFISLLALGNSVMDPFIYGYFNRDIRGRVRQITNKICQCYRRTEVSPISTISNTGP
ncbi:adenosine receptor A2b-like [Saccoglossus kowalevskii]|uniref:Adenosine receptor A2a-like n=1 Tax=Saccoglossus kowalevskii TaxID=10224 RepID=A0ABM0M7S7_SACKO|nr:PREDICTED: adenosine receptor A2a-like [Saccoglossus kowalevskii]